MSELEHLIKNLSAEKRTLLQKRFAKKQQNPLQVIPRWYSKGPCPLSYAQELMWLLESLVDTNAYYVSRTIRLTGALNVEALEQTLCSMVARHEVLRTTYHQDADGKPVQVVNDDSRVRLHRIDLSCLPEQEREPEAKRILIEESHRRFDLSRDMLLRALLVRLSEQSHILFLLTHHIASDGDSKSVLFREMGYFYDCYCRGAEPKLPDLPIQYTDYAIWEREYMQGDVLQTLLTYWKAQLEGAPMLVNLPFDRPRPALQQFGGARETVSYPAPLLAALKQLASGEQMTLFMTMLAAFGTLVYRWSGHDDILIGTPYSSRNRAELEPLIGYVCNSVALRLDLTGNPTFRELLGRVREVALGAYSHQDLPFEKLVFELAPERDLSHSPVYQLMFAAGEQLRKRLELRGLEVDIITLIRDTSKFDMTLGLGKAEGNNWVGYFEYCTALFDRTTIVRFGHHYRNLLESIAANPDQRIASLAMLSSEERHRIVNQWNDASERKPMLVGWNQTYRDSSQDVLVHQLFERQAESTPDATAVVCEDRQLSYRQLNARANQLAHFLKKRGVGPDVPVAICVERSLEMIVGVMGILKAGGAYVPLDSAYVRERLPIILQDAECPLLLTQSDLLKAIPDTAAEVIALDRHGEVLADESQENPAHEATRATLAYVVYTSGSTGVPKGVMVTHGSLLNAYQAWEAEYELQSSARSHLQMANFSFDVFSGDLVRALCSGGKLVVCPMELLLNPAALYSLMLRERVDCAEFVPAVLRALVGYLQETGQKLDFMRLLVAGSDTWSVDEYRGVLQLCGPKTRLINSYGVAEATIDSTYFETRTGQELRREGFVPIGRPFPNVQVYVLDSQMQPAPIGVAGTLYVGGAGVARGYLKRPELTAEKFVRDPFRSEPGARLYNTGDAARYLPDGNIEFLGRTDNQVKIRGFRIEPGEIEAVIGKYPGVQQSVVAARELSPGQLGLVAYIVPVAGKSLDIGDLRSFLKGKLPAYMLPSAFEVLDRIPLNANGKVDHKALPAPKKKSADLEKTFVAPRSDMEEKLASIWAEVLQFSPVGVYDNFFALGGHSLMGIQVISRIRTHLQVELPLRSLFENPTISELSVAIEANREDGRSTESLIVPVNRESVRVERTQEFSRKISK